MTLSDIIYHRILQLEPGPRMALGLKLFGFTQKMIARETRRSVSLVNAVVYQREGNKSQNPEVRSAIANKLGLPVTVAFKDHDNHCNATILIEMAESVNGKT